MSVNNRDNIIVNKIQLLISNINKDFNKIQNGIRKKNNKLTKSKIDMESLTKNFYTKTQQYKNEAITLTTKIEKILLEKQTLEENNKELNKQINALQDILNELNNKGSVNANKIKKLSNTTQTLESNKLKLGIKINELQSQLNMLQNKTNLNKQTSGETVKNLEQTIIQLTTAKQNLENKQQILQEQENKLRQKLNQILTNSMKLKEKTNQISKGVNNSS